MASTVDIVNGGLMLLGETLIASLTDDFSMAFLTSVIGLPLSAILRTVFIVLNASLAPGSMPSTKPASGGDKPLTTLFRS